MRTLLMLGVMLSSVGCAFLTTSSHERKLIGTYEYKKNEERYTVDLTRDFFGVEQFTTFFGGHPNHATTSEISGEILEQYNETLESFKDDGSSGILAWHMEQGPIKNEYWEWRYEEEGKTLHFSGPGFSLFGPTKTFIVNDDGSLTEFKSTTGGLFGSKRITISESKRRTLQKIK